MRLSCQNLAFATLICGSLGCNNQDPVEHVAPNAFVDGLENGDWVVYVDSLGGAYASGTFDKGAKVNTWKYVDHDTVFSVQFKRNPVLVSGFRLGVPVGWVELETDQFSFIALDTAGSRKTIIVNKITEPADTVSLQAFANLAMSTLVNDTSYHDVQYEMKALSLSNGDSVVIGRLEYIDGPTAQHMMTRYAYKKIDGGGFIDTSVSGQIRDSIRVVAIFNDFISNVVYESSKLLPYRTSVEAVTNLNASGTPRDIQ